MAADTPGELKRDPRAAAREPRAEQYFKRDAEVRLVLSRATGSGGRCLP